MDKKFLIVLFAAIFYNGVIYASPVNEHKPDVILPEEKPPTALPVTVDHKKVQSTTTAVPDHSTSVTQKPLNHSETELPAVTATPDKIVSVVPHVVQLKNTTADLHPNQNASSVTDKPVKPANQTVNEKTTVTPKSLPTEVPPVTKSSVSTSTPAAPTTTTSASTAAVTTTSPTASANSTDKIAVVHNVPVPVQEKRFDGPSFIGGIILTIGVTAIGFIAFKFIKSGKIDMNYRTL